MTTRRDQTPERFYRLLDGVYRLHDDLYYVEDAILRSTLAQVRLSQISAQTRLGAGVGALVVGVPVLIAISPLDWQSASIWWVITGGVALIIFLFWQMRQANQAAEELALAERLSEKAPLERRLDYQLETINASAHRIRVVEEVLEALDADLTEAEGTEIENIERRVQRYHEIRQSCADRILQVLQASHAMVLTEARSADDHEIVLDWASPYLDDTDLSRYRGA